MRNFEIKLNFGVSKNGVTFTFLSLKQYNIADIFGIAPVKFQNTTEES
jgi:hypothetical protein